MPIIDKPTDLAGFPIAYTARLVVTVHLNPEGPSIAALTLYENNIPAIEGVAGSQHDLGGLVLRAVRLLMANAERFGHMIPRAYDETRPG